MALGIAQLRELAGTQLDASAYADDERQRKWLTKAGYRHTRTWLQMSRPVPAAEGEPGALPGPREGVTVRRVAKHDDGLPVAQDLQTVHQMLEESFADHFNSYRESFPEFVQRLREDPGHRWDHWWIAEIDVDGEQVPGGALVSSVLPAGRRRRRGQLRRLHRRAPPGPGPGSRQGAAAHGHRRRRTARPQPGRPRGRRRLPDRARTACTSRWAGRPKYRTESWHRDVTVEGRA